MNVKQVSTILNETIKQMSGDVDIADLTITDVVDMGKTESKDWLDKFYGNLYDRIYKFVMSIRSYTPTEHNIFKDYQTFGAALEKVYVDPMKAQENKAWLLNNNQSVDPFVINKQTTKVKVFSDRNTWSLPFTIFDNQTNSAFNSETELTAFVSNLFLAIDNDFKAQIEAIEELTKINFIAQKLIYKKSHATSKGVINLLQEYKNVHADSQLTATTCREDKEFLRFSAMLMTTYVNKLEKRNTLFNNEQYYRFTPKDMLHVDVLNDFAKSMKFYLESDTYHNDLVALPRYSEVMYWQGTGTDYNFNDCSAINVTIGENKVEQANIVAFIYDTEAMGITVWNERTTSQYNASGEYTNYFKKADIGCYNDVSEQAIVFIIEDVL